MTEDGWNENCITDILFFPATPFIWNTLSANVRLYNSEDIFKQKFKTHLFILLSWTALACLYSTIISAFFFVRLSNTLQMQCVIIIYYYYYLRVPTLSLEKNQGLFQDFQGPTWEIFQDLFGACECLNIKKKHLLLTTFRV